MFAPRPDSALRPERYSARPGPTPARDGAVDRYDDGIPLLGGAGWPPV
jgi:hypothetical protein